MEWAKCQIILQGFQAGNYPLAFGNQSRKRSGEENAEEKGSALEHSREDMKADSRGAGEKPLSQKNQFQRCSPFPGPLPR